MSDENPLVEIEKIADKNLWLWRLNETTPPSKTKPVSFGRKFTATDTYYQIKRATETFGPVGIGWGWETEDEVVTAEGKEGSVSFAKCKVSLWYRDPRNPEVICRPGPVIGTNTMFLGGKPDDDAFKKATTDAITKSLSYLGFSADIFMGLYDDSKYVDKLRQQENTKADATGSKLPEILTKAIAELPKARDVNELGILWKSIQPDLKALDTAQLDFMKARFARRKSQMAPSQDDPSPAQA
jgi:hypothetical protein